MVISVLEHGLGNQLFQYATGRAVAARLKTPLFLDKLRFAYNRTRDLELSKFRIRARMLPDRVAALLGLDANAPGWKARLGKVISAGIRTYEDPQRGYDQTIFSGRGHLRLDGFWQSERYFRDLRPQLLAELEPREPLPTTLAAFVQRVAGEESVAVHVRRGDVANNGAYAATAGALAAEYYARALAWFQERVPAAKFYVFSDDAAWCERHLPRQIPLEIVSGKLTRSAVHDLTVMKHCRHFLVGNSTFSWWGAWLGADPAKRVLAPARFFRVQSGWEMDLRPPEWETMEPIWEEVG